MISVSNPYQGWCDFKLGDFTEKPSYLTNVPIVLLDAFIEYYQKWCGSAWFDGDDEFSLVLTPFRIFIVNYTVDFNVERQGRYTVYEVNRTIIDLGKELIDDIEKDLNKWASFYACVNDDIEKREQNRSEIKEKIKILKDLKDNIKLDIKENELEDKYNEI